MLKIIKYEFRKNRTGLVIMLLIVACLFTLAALGRLLKRDALLGISTSILLLYTFATYIYVLVRGIAAYSGELKGRTGYLLMMVPRSTMSILFGKLLFTLAFSLLMLAASGLALMGAGSFLFARARELEGYQHAVQTFSMIRYAMESMGIDLLELLYMAAAFVIEILSSILVVVSIAYLAVTLGATILQEGRLRGFISLLLFVALFALTTAITDWISPEGPYDNSLAVLCAALPAVLLHLCLTCAFTTGSAILLKEKVTL